MAATKPESETRRSLAETTGQHSAPWEEDSGQYAAAVLEAVDRTPTGIVDASPIVHTM